MHCPERRAQELPIGARGPTPTRGRVSRPRPPRRLQELALTEFSHIQSTSLPPNVVPAVWQEFLSRHV